MAAGDDALDQVDLPPCKVGFLACAGVRAGHGGAAKTA